MIDINLNIPIDTTPTDGSTNLIDSNAVFDGLATKESNLPSMVGNSLKVLRVNAGETGKEWATISTGLTIGTTPITSGTVGRVLFEGAGNVAQEDSSFFWDNTNKRLGIGATPATTVRLDIRAQGALSTDIAFRIRNSADTLDLLSVNGQGTLAFNAPTSNMGMYVPAPNVMAFYTSGAERFRIFSNGNFAIGNTNDLGYKFNVVGASRFSGRINISTIATSPTGLVAGDIWNNGGILTIV